MKEGKTNPVSLRSEPAARIRERRSGMTKAELFWFSVKSDSAFTVTRGIYDPNRDIRECWRHLRLVQLGDIARVRVLEPAQ